MANSGITKVSISTTLTFEAENGTLIVTASDAGCKITVGAQDNDGPPFGTLLCDRADLEELHEALGQLLGLDEE
jgi:hypothetical protein